MPCGLVAGYFAKSFAVQFTSKLVVARMALAVTAEIGVISTTWVVARSYLLIETTFVAKELIEIAKEAFN